MTDRQTRTLQRRALDGDAARALWLLQRQRLGELTATYTVLAAQLGDPAARRLVEVERIEVTPSGQGQVRRWKRAFRDAGRQPLVLLAWAAAREALEVTLTWGQETQVYLEPPGRHSVGRLLLILERVGAWLLEPTPERREAVRELRRRFGDYEPGAHLRMVPSRVGWLADRLVDAVLDWPANSAVRDVLDASATIALWGRRLDRDACHERLRQLLVTWLLEGALDLSLPAPPAVAVQAAPLAGLPSA